MVHACCHSEVLLSLEMRMSYHTLCVPFQNLFSDINPVQSHTEGTENDIWCQQQLGRWGQLHAAFRTLPQPAAAPHPSQNWKALCKCQCGKKLQKRSNSTGNEAPLTPSAYHLLLSVWASPWKGEMKNNSKLPVKYRCSRNKEHFSKYVVKQVVLSSWGTAPREILYTDS